MSWPNTFIWISLAFGFVSGIARMISMHSRTHPQAEIVWRQPLLSGRKYTLLSRIVVTVHSLGLICLTALLLFDLIQREVLLLFPVGLNPPEIVILAVVAAFFATYTSAGAIACHLVRRWIRTVLYGISQDGISFGENLVCWKNYSRYEIGPGDGQISLYSSYSPSLRTWVLQPRPESLARVLELIQKNLPRASAMDDSIAWQRSPLTLVLGMLALVLVALLPAIWGLLQDVSWIWIYSLAAFSLLNILGNKWMTMFDGRGTYPEQKVELI